MNFLKALFGSKTETIEERKEEENAKNFDVLKYDGVRAMQIGQIAYAIQCFSHALKLKEDLETRDYLSQTLIRNGDLLPAYDQLLKLSEAHPDNLNIFIRMADVAYMMEDYQAMANACEKALLVDDRNVQVLFFYARACKGQGDDANAIAMLTKALSLESDYGDARLMRGEIYLDVDDLDSADADAVYLLQHTQDSEEVFLLKARIETKRGNHAHAIDYLNKIIALNPFSAVAFRERSAAKQALGDAVGAEEDCKNADEIEPEKENQNAGLADEEAQLGIEEKVKRAYRNNNPYGFG